MSKLPIFHFSLLHPRYWLMWLGIGLLYFLVLFPYPILYYIGIFLGCLARTCIPNRVQIARRNLYLCFPDMPTLEREKLLKKNFESVGMGLIETGMAWFWPDWRIKRLFKKINGLEHIKKARRKHRRGILLIGLHFLTLELGARILGILNPGIGIYRPNDNLLLEWLQTWGRLRSNKSMLNRTDVKGIIRALMNGEILWYAPDHDYGPKSSVFVPFFAVPDAATTSGIYRLVRITKPALIPFVPRRLPNGEGYELLILPDENRIPLDSDIATAHYINQVVEQVILLAPDQYMWLHRRFKTRPPGKPSLYE